MTTATHKGLVSEIVLATSRLVSALEAEVAALQRGDVASLAITQSEKARLFRNYEAKVQALKTQPALQASVGPAVSAELSEATARLETAIERNVAQLRAASEANRRLVDAIARAAVEAARTPSYGPPAAIAHAARTHSGGGVGALSRSY